MISYNSKLFLLRIVTWSVGILPVQNKIKSTSAVKGKIRLTVAQDQDERKGTKQQFGWKEKYKEKEE